MIPAQIIIQQVADYYHIEVFELISTIRMKEIVKARHIAIYFCKQFSNMSLCRIGMYFKGRGYKAYDHTTVIYAIKQVLNQMDVYPAYRGEIDEIENIIKDKEGEIKIYEEEGIFMQNDFF